MARKIWTAILCLSLLFSLSACGTANEPNTGAIGSSESSSYENVEGTKIKMITDNTEVVITLNNCNCSEPLRVQ